MTQIKRILCIEDDVFIGEMYRRSLLKDGYEVDLISNGDDGLKAARTGTYDLILLDIMLPERKGTDILRILRGEGENLVPHTRIVILTNYDQDDESKLDMQNKVEGYLIKADITPRRLRDIIKSFETQN